MTATLRRRQRSPERDTVGHYWIDCEGQVWRQIAYTDRPVASFECVDGRSKGKRLDEVIDCPLMLERGLRLLRPETNISGVAE